MEEDRMPKKVFTREMEGSRRMGRLRKGWKEEIERDLQVLGVRRWTELVTGKNGRIFSAGQSPQWAVLPVEEEDKIVDELTEMSGMLFCLLFYDAASV
jgi:hypothetical protein